ncbi:unnamed protein product [Linum tenue]|uniref:Uncharacterized protein n=1 Tax=Linum tenue TaxID=586396 RepID=A0AAV0QKC2_9ROSI|nr:unnamed protein product [Linum tenue]
MACPPLKTKYASPNVLRTGIAEDKVVVAKDGLTKCLPVMTTLVVSLFSDDIFHPDAVFYPFYIGGFGYLLIMQFKPRSEGSRGPKSSSPVFALARQSSSNPSIKEKKREVRGGKHTTIWLRDGVHRLDFRRSRMNLAMKEEGASEIVDAYSGKRSRLPGFDLILPSSFHPTTRLPETAAAAGRRESISDGVPSDHPHSSDASPPPCFFLRRLYFFCHQAFEVVKARKNVVAREIRITRRRRSYDSSKTRPDFEIVSRGSQLTVAAEVVTGKLVFGKVDLVWKIFSFPVLEM